MGVPHSLYIVQCERDNSRDPQCLLTAALETTKTTTDIHRRLPSDMKPHVTTMLSVYAQHGVVMQYMVETIFSPLNEPIQGCIV